MAGGYDGSIRIDTSINTQPLSSGLNAIEGKIKGLAGSIGIIFGTKELIEFGGTAITAASDLQEAQNVVDTAFGAMSHKMEQFADTALDVYGISELTAKQMGSTYMAMAKGMGVATNAASDMAVTLTGRLSDIMSFYNKTQSEVDTIGRAIITGETEPIKAIGVVMTQANLAAYTMAEGFGKAYEEMSASEQLIVRYKYFLEQTALAQGDFAKTSEGWANQTRTLNERFGEFMTNLGGVLMNTFTPAIRFANEAVAFINELFFGGNAEDTATAKSAAAVADEVSAVGTAAEKSEKKLNSLMSGFDELHVISGAKKDNSNELNTTAIDTSDLLGVSLEADTSLAKKAANRYREILNEIYLAFKRHPLTKIIGEIIDSIGDFFGVIKDNGDIDYGGMVTLLMDFLGALLMFKGVSGVVGAVKTFSSGFGGLLKVITAHPVAAAAIGLAALAAGIYALSLELKKQDIASHFGDISISFAEIDELTTPISEDIEKVATAFDTHKSQLSDANENFINIAKSVQQTADAFKNGNLEQDVRDFAIQLDEYINAAGDVNSMITDTSALEALYAADGEITESERQTIETMNKLENTVAGRIESIRLQIQSITQTAIDQNRDLLESELENIQALYDEIARMTATQESIKTEAAWERLKNGAYSYNSYAELSDAIKQAQEQAETARNEVEKSAYEDIVSKAHYMEVNGISLDEIESFKKEAFADIASSLKDMEHQAKIYERDVITAWAQGAFENVSKYIDDSPEAQKKMQQYFNLMLSAPDNVDVYKIGSKLGDAEYIRNVYSVLDEMNGQFSIDFLKEWNNLNSQIGDSGGVTAEEYYENMEAVLQNADGIDTTKLLSGIEAFKNNADDGMQVYTEAIMKWLDNTDLEMVIGTRIDTTEADKWLSEHVPTNGFEYYGSSADAWWQNTSASYGQQPLTAGYAPEIKTETTTNINLSVNGVTQERMSFVGPVNNAEITLRSNGTR